MRDVIPSGVVFLLVLGVAGCRTTPMHSSRPGEESAVSSQFHAWLDAFNSGDRVALLAYHAHNFPDAAANDDVGNIEHEMGLSHGTGGFELKKLEQSSPTSKRTFSGGEELAYDLRALGRAKTIGETTGGGAHPVAPHVLDDQFQIGVPSGRPINPVTKTDWEGVGVVPDVKVPAESALAAAHRLALEALGRAKP